MSARLFLAGVFATIVVVGGCSEVCLAEEVSSSVAQRFMNNPDLPVIVRGDYFKAIQVAYHDFSKVLARRAREANSSANTNRDFALRLSKIENYDIHVEQAPLSYTVWFRPSMRDTDDVVMGGGATYTVERNTFSIAKKVLSK